MGIRKEIGYCWKINATPLGIIQPGMLMNEA